MPAFVSRYATAFADVVADLGLDTTAIDHQFSDFLATWDGSTELRTFFVNPAVPAIQKVAILDKLNAKLGMLKELRNLIAVLIDNDRIAHVADVAAGYRQLLQERMGIRPAAIVTARKLTKDEGDSPVAESEQERAHCSDQIRLIFTSPPLLFFKLRLQGPGRRSRDHHLARRRHRAPT